MRDVTFNLVDEPWLLARDLSGKTRQVSLRQLIVGAENYTELSGEVPTQTFALLRLLLAVLHRALGGPVDVEHWRAITHDWEGVATTTLEYLDEHHARFDLRHPSKPFYQSAGLRTAKDEHSGLEKMIADVPNGRPFLTTRLKRGVERISWGEAARWLVHTHAFDPDGIRSGTVGDRLVTSGKRYPRGVTAWAGAIGGVHVVGPTLARTLVLNLVVPEDAGVTSGPEDLPAWERDDADTPPSSSDPKHAREPRGPIDVYTWQCRRIRLIGDDDGVTGAVLTHGDGLWPQNRQNLEPMSAWRFSEPQTKKAGAPVYMPKTHDPARSVWRGLEALLPQASPSASADQPRYRVPGVLRWMQSLAYEGELAETIVEARAIGVEYGPQSSTYAEIVDDRLVLPVTLLGPEGQAPSVAAIDAVAAAETAVRGLRDFAANLADAAGASGETDGRRDLASLRAYAQLSAKFTRWVLRLDAPEATEAALDYWHLETLEVIRGIAASLAADAGPQALCGRDVGGRFIDLGLAERWLDRKLREALPRAYISTNGATDV